MRNVERTKARILRATGRILARSGFQKLGVNAVADAAGIGKPLIYRYFGGLPELLEAYGRGGNFWPTTEELIGADLGSDSSYGGRLGQVLVALLDALRRRPVTQQILAWELIESNALTRRLEELRAADARALVMELRATVTPPPPDIDAPAINALLVAAIHYLVIRARESHGFSGLSLRTEEDWARVAAALETIVQRTFAAASMPHERAARTKAARE